MILKTKHERDIIRRIIIVPIIFVLIFTFISYILIKYLIIPKNEVSWEEQLTQEYYEKTKKNILDECLKIYNLIIDERNEQKEFIKSHLKKQNETFIETLEMTVYPKLVDENLNFDFDTVEQMRKKFPYLIANIDDVKNEGYVVWIEEKNKYEGYYKKDKDKIHLTYIDSDKLMAQNRREVLKKVMKLKFPQENYIFVLGYDGIIHGHHKKELVENPNLKDIDPRRYKNLTEIVSYARLHGKDFMEYTTGTKITPESFEEKISYLIPDDEWSIVIGFGLTKREIYDRIEKEKSLKNKLVNDILLNMLLIVFIYIIIHTIIMYLFGKIIAKKFLDYKDISILEKEKIVQLLHDQNKYLSPKENIINDFVPLAVLDKNFQFKNCTKKFSDLFEINEEDLYGESIFKIMTEKNEIELKNFKMEIGCELEIKDELFKTFHKNDVWLSIKIKKEAKGYCGEPIGFTIVCEEVGEKLSIIKKFNKEQEKNEIQEQIILQQSKLAAIGTTVDSIAHQWKQPLAVVSGEINNLILKVRKHKTADRMVDLKYLQENIEKIEETIGFLSETIEAFNTFYDSNEENVLIDITKLIKDTFKIMIPSTSSNVYKITYDVENDVYAFGAKGLYQQVILTLIHNAIEAFNEKKISNRSFNVYVRNEGEYNVCIIEDNAGGIEEDIITKIFELNFSTKKKNKLGNSGLGLFLARVVLEEKFEDGTIVANNTANGVAFIIKTKNIDLKELI